MNHATLLIGPPEGRSDAIANMLDAEHIPQSSRISIGAGTPAIGIDQVRSFIRAIQLKPFSGLVTAGVIDNAHLLTAEAQQALLKTLEEPPAHTRIILGVPGEDTLLPTIRSRCTVIRLPDAGTSGSIHPHTQADTTVNTLLTGSPGHIIQALDQAAKTKDDALQLLDVLITELAGRLCESSGEEKNLRPVLTGLLESKKLVRNNIHPLMLLERTFLKRFAPTSR